MRNAIILTLLGAALLFAPGSAKAFSLGDHVALSQKLSGAQVEQVSRARRYNRYAYTGPRRYNWSYYPYWRPYQYHYWQFYYPYGGPLF